MSIASCCLGSLGNQASTAGSTSNSNQSVVNQTQNTNQQSPTTNSIVMNNSSLSNGGSNGLSAFSFGSLSNGTNASSLSPTDNHVNSSLNSVVGSGLTQNNNNGQNSSATFTKCILCNQQYGSPKGIY